MKKELIHTLVSLCDCSEVRNPVAYKMGMHSREKERDSQRSEEQNFGELNPDQRALEESEIWKQVFY